MTDTTFAWITVLAGGYVYAWARRKGDEFFLAFLLLLPLWGPRCAVHFMSARRALELRWEDVFLVMLLVRWVLMRAPRLKIQGAEVGFVAFFGYAATLLIIRVGVAGHTPSVLYLLLYVKFLAYLVVVQGYLSGLREFSWEAFRLHFTRLATILLVGEGLGILYQVVSSDFNFNRSLGGAVLGTDAWRLISGGFQKDEFRSNILFDTEPSSTGLVLTCLSLLVMFNSRRYLLWAGLSAVVMFLTTSKTGILAVATAIVTVLVTRRRERLLLQPAGWTAATLASVTGLNLLYLLSAPVQRFVLMLGAGAVSLMRTLARLVSTQLGVVLVGFGLGSLRNRVRLVHSKLAGFDGLWWNWIYGYSGHGIFDNVYLFALCVFGLLGVALFLTGHVWAVHRRMQDLRRVSEGQRLWAYSIYATLGLVLAVFGFTAEPLKHVRTINFLYPALLAAGAQLGSSGKGLERSRTEARSSEVEHGCT